MLTLCLALLAQDTLRVEGPPFLVSGETIELRAVSPAENATVVWRLSDGAAAVETKPAYDPRSLAVRGTSRIELSAVGSAETDVRVSVSLERRGTRVATVEHRVRIGPLLRVRAWCRVVENGKGGTRRPDLARDGASRGALQDGVNRLLRPVGIEVALEAGLPVHAPDAWFDAEGRFHPVELKDGGKANSAALSQLLKCDQPGGLNLYFLRECRWTSVREGFVRSVTDHALVGIGLKEGQVVADDAADATVLAHELGHAFSLDDLWEKGERGRLMYSLRKERTGVSLTWQEMKDARERARLHLKSQPRR
jgi:hypothetical protein